MSFTKVTRATEDINTGFGRFNTLIDDLASASNAKGASQIGIEDTAGNMAATDVEAALAEIYTDTSSTRTLAELFDENSATTTGLTWGYKAGTFRVDNTVTSVSAGTIGLTDDATNYVEVDPSDGLVKKNTTAFTTARIPLRQIVTASGSQSTSTDKRAWFSNPATATTSVIGIVELSTDAEAVTGTSDAVVMTPGTTTAKLNDYTKDEDDMTSNSDTHICTQQSIKAYADLAVKIADTDVSSTGWVVDEDNMASDLDTKVPTQQSVKAYVDSSVLYDAYLMYSEVQASNTAGGGATAGSWQTRTLNTEDADTDNIGSLSSNQITLPAGTYVCKASAPAYKLDEHKIRIYDTTNTTTLLLGTSEYISGAIAIAGRAFVSGEFTLGGEVAIEVQHYCNRTQAANGFGYPCNIASVNEVYTTIEIWRRS